MKKNIIFLGMILLLSLLMATAVTAFCGENQTLFQNCFMQNTANNCNLIPSCSWTTDTFNPGGGRCEPSIFAQCFGNQTRHLNRINCQAQVGGIQICSWTNDTFSPQGGFCNPICFGLAGNAAACEIPTNGLCELKAGFCEPNSFGGKCFQADGNITQCNGALNQTCTYFIDPAANNGKNGTVGNFSGWCNSKSDAGFVNFMGNIEPAILGMDEDENNINNSWDISGVGLREDFDRIVFGMKLYDDFAKSGICNNIPLINGNLGNGRANHTFFWYVDADGNNSNNCVARDNASQAGYEFSFKYQGAYTSVNTLTEIKVSYRCINGSWGAVPIPLTSDKQKMCNLIGGGMAGIDKSELFKFKNLYNKTSNLRIYVTVGNLTNNDSSVMDTSGPFYYSQGSVDFKFEDCSDVGGDADGDGMTASNDPDCFDFMKFGFVPTESGFQCGDGTDNDGDGLTDCADNGCSWDNFVCGGSLAPDANDKTAPTIKWQKVDTFPNAASIMYDTNEPANGTVSFYWNDSKCKTLNQTIKDVGLIDDFLQDYKLWHDGPLDAFSYNPQPLKIFLNNSTTYYFKTTVCDVSGNCAYSACTNFTTKSSASSCKSCSSTMNFPFTPSSGASTTDPLGNLQFKFELPDGTKQNLSSNAGSGAQFNYSQTKNFNLEITNPNSSVNWSFKLINASINGKLSSSFQNFSAAGGDISFNQSVNGSFVGLGNTKCEEMINALRPKKIELGLPGNVSELWQCDYGLANCTKKSIGTNATLVGYNSTLNMTRWIVPADWGC